MNVRRNQIIAVVLVLAGVLLTLLFGVFNIQTRLGDGEQTATEFVAATAGQPEPIYEAAPSQGDSAFFDLDDQIIATDSTVVDDTGETAGFFTLGEQVAADPVLSQRSSTTLATLSGTGWTDVDPGDPLVDFLESTDGVNDRDLSRFGTELAAAGPPGQSFYSDEANFNLWFIAEDAELTDVAFVEGALLAGSTAPATFYIWELEEDFAAASRLESSVFDDDASIVAVGALGGDRVFALASDGQLEIGDWSQRSLDHATSQPWTTLELGGFGSPLMAVGLADGSMAAVFDRDTQHHLIIISAAALDRPEPLSLANPDVTTVGSYDLAITALAASPDADRSFVVAGDVAGGLIVVDATGALFVQATPGGGPAIEELEFLPNGEYVALDASGRALRFESR